VNLRLMRIVMSLALAALWAGACGGGGGGSSSGVEGGGATEHITITSAPQIDCLATTECDVTLQATGNASPIQWGVVTGTGALPTGMSLDAGTGRISGTPTILVGPQSVDIQAADAKASAVKVFTFNVYQKDSINPITPANAHLHAPYSLTVNGVGKPYQGSIGISVGTLPPGLSLTPGDISSSYLAVIAGTPTQAGTYPFTVQMKDTSISEIPQTVTASATIVVDTHLTIVKAKLNDAVVGKAYSDAFAAVNGTPPLRWSVSGTPPDGLTVDAASGTMSGTTTGTSGSSSFSVSVSDASAPVESDTAAATLDVEQPLQIPANPLPAAYIGKAYTLPIEANGGTLPYKWSVLAGSLPPGITFSTYNEFSAEFSGTARQLGTYNITIQATDSGSPPQVATQAFTIVVSPLPLTSGAPLSPAPINEPYHSQIPASSGTPPYSWTITSGNLPPGLILNASTGSIDGTPTQIGTFNFVAKITDSGNPVQTGSFNDFIVIRKQLGRNDSIATATPIGNTPGSNPGPFSISPYVDPIGATTANPDTDYYRLIATGGSVVHVETLADRAFGSDPLDSVIEILNSSGQRMTTCTAPSFTSGCMNDDIDPTTRDSALDVKVPGAANTNTTFYLHVLDWRGDARPDMQYELSVSGVVEPLSITTTLGAGATRGVNYAQQFTTMGGTGAVTWLVSGGALPPGWALSAAGLLSGTPTTDGTYTFAISARDSANPPQTAAQQFTLQIAEPVVITSPGTFPNACVNEPYSFQTTTTGGIPPLAFNAAPSWVGISFDPHTGLFTGSAPTTGTFTATFSVVDSAQPKSIVVQSISITVVTCP